MRIKTREIDASGLQQLMDAGYPVLMARLLSARGVRAIEDLAYTLNQLIHPSQLMHGMLMAEWLADAIFEQKRIIVIGDYDADGATATAIAVKGLRRWGATVDFLVPNRFAYGYGLTPEIVDLAMQASPDILLTVDNGIASVDGVAHANALGLEVLITDHHLPGEILPKAACIVNPNQPGCGFPSKHLAGVGVMFYVLLCLRRVLQDRGHQPDAQLNLTELLDLVALGTVADLVKLDRNNRILVEQGLRRIRAGKACVGIQALMRVSGRENDQVSAQDLGFYMGPRLNAAGRLDDMSIGIRCLITEDPVEASGLAERLHHLNLERRQIEAEMQQDAMVELEAIELDGRFTISLYSQEWHQGVVGILASRVKEQYHRPVIIFAQAGEGVLKGSGRSIPGLHLRDALDLVTKKYPDLIMKFGGHAMAAGLSIHEVNFQMFSVAFEQIVRTLISEDSLLLNVETDGELTPEELSLASAEWIAKQVWGQGFPSPVFKNRFEVIQQRILADRHLKLSLARNGQIYEAIYFNFSETLPTEVDVIYELQINRYQGQQSLQLMIKHVITQDAVTN